MKRTTQHAGSVRVVSKRWTGTQPETGETVIDCDRTNPVLGNRHKMNGTSLSERERVIAANLVDLQADIARNGPMSQTLDGMVQRVLAGEKLALACWCAPCLCHVDNYANEIRRRVQIALTGNVS